MAATRGKCTCPVYGISNELQTNQLPTVQQIMQFYSFTRDNKPYNLKMSEVIKDVANNVISIWTKAGIPTVSAIRVRQKIENLREDLRVILKKKDDLKLAAVATAKQESKSLFDIAACHCADFSDCNCAREFKVPTLEREFLMDQRTVRKMFIAGLDKTVTAKMQQAEERSRKRRKYYASVVCDEACSTATCSATTDISDTEAEANPNPIEEICCNPDLDTELVEKLSNQDDEYEVSSDSNLSESGDKRNMTQFPTVARECDRYGVSNAAGAAIATAALTDYGIITSDNYSAVIDRSKLRRQREKLRTSLTQGAVQSLARKGPTCLYFDGRKDSTLCPASINTKCTTVEEHVTLIEEPHSLFIGHVTPKNSSSASICGAIIDHFSENNISMENFTAVGADGTNVNTGCNGGVIRLLELHVGRPLQWFICMYHCNELPLRHLMMKLDGTTASPAQFNGTIGKALQDCHKLPINTQFQSRRNHLPQQLHDASTIDISKDQKYLFDICKGIELGIVSDSLARKEPGPVVHSRWLTTANRILRLYVSDKQPSAELVLLTDYVLQVYAPVWFSIKLEPECFKGVKHLWLMAKLSRFLPDDVREVVDRSIERNCFFAHPENLLLTMLTDERKEIRELAARRVKAARLVRPKDVRKFVLPTVNVTADNYDELVNWQDYQRTEPPMMMNITNEEIDIAIETGQRWTLDNFPCHTQAVERHVKLVTEAAAAVCGELRRDGYVRAKLLSRSIIPHFDVKKDWKSQ